ncbi:hypothetical protein AOQ84DRAFT_217727 [Glonium stellatum]|uniref:CFEM domain-containing protein n=1 Tax=Glonium stellatum TaxID=574774 RepID=A0A8E2F4H6_9PEZI|nr:hypothetical protein AOQ84DRAFT_217727 [Glonium stellatum]
MLLSHFNRLVIFSSTLIAALPQHPTSTSLHTSLPSSLQSSIPACAQPCVASSLYDQFPLSCTSQGDLNCLCSHYSTSGLSLGEVALGCLYAACPSEPGSLTATVYNICLGQRNAVEPTHSALTVTALPTTVPFITSTTIPTSTAQTAISSVSSIRKSLSANPQSSSAPTSALFVSAMSTPTASIQPSPALSSNGNVTTSAHGPGPLSTAQIVGISVAGIAAIILAVGAMILSVCLRRRHERQAKDDDQQGSEKGNPNSVPLIIQPLAPLPKNDLRDPRRGGGGVGVAPIPRTGPGLSYSRVTPNNSDTQPSQGYGLGLTNPDLSREISANVDVSNPSVPLEEIGLAISPDTERHASPESVASSRTMSRLLPEKPVPILGMPRVPQRPEVPPMPTDQQRPRIAAMPTVQQRPEIPAMPPMPPMPQRPESFAPRPDSVMTTATVFEEDVPLERRSVRINLPPLVPVPPLKTFKPQRQPQLPQAQYVPTRPTQTYSNSTTIEQLPLSLRIPIRQYQPVRTPSPVRIPTALVASAPSAHASSYYGSRASESSLDMSDEGYIPDYYISPEKPLPRTDKASPEILGRPSRSPKLVQIRSKPSSSNISRTTSRTSGSKRDSGTSDTSFESADPNEPTPSEDDKQLSPVAESPISNIRYPKVPRASNQAVPRSPRSPKSPKSPRSPRSPGKRADATPLAPSLLVKRRGEKQAQQLENMFWAGDGKGLNIRAGPTGGQHRRSGSDEYFVREPERAAQQAASRDHRRSKSINAFEMQRRNPGREPLKSPLWVPKLTPTRKGNDLLISVT